MQARYAILLYGRVREEEEILALYDAVTREQVRELLSTVHRSARTPPARAK